MYTTAAATSRVLCALACLLFLTGWSVFFFLFQIVCLGHDRLVLFFVRLFALSFCLRFLSSSIYLVSVLYRI